MSSFFCNFLCRLLHITFPEKHTFCGVFVGVNRVRLLVCFQVSRANNVRPYDKHHFFYVPLEKGNVP